MKTPKLTAPFGASLVILSSFFYASYGMWTTWMGNFFGGYGAAFFRSIVVLIVLVPLAAATHQLTRLDWKQIWPYFVGLAVTTAMVWGPLYYAILQAGVGMTLAVNYASIVVGMFVLGRIFAGERFTPDKWFSASLGLAGIALVFMPNVSSFGWLALGAAVLSGFGSAANMVVAKKLPTNATQTSILVWIASGVANLPMMFVVGEVMPLFGWHIEWFYLVMFGLASLVATWTFVQGIKLIEAGAAGVLGLFEIVFGVLLGVVLFNEQPHLIALGGIVLILLSAAVPYIKDYNASRGTLEA